MSTSSAINANTVTFTVNTQWFQPEHNEQVLALNEARDAAFDEIQNAYVAAYDEIEDQIQRLKAKQEVLEDQKEQARHVVTREHQKAVKAARGQQDDDE